MTKEKTLIEIAKEENKRWSCAQCSMEAKKGIIRTKYVFLRLENEEQVRFCSFRHLLTWLINNYI